MKKRVKRFTTNLWDILNRPDMAVLPAQLAYFFILSLVPTFTVIMYVASFLSISLEEMMQYVNVHINPTLLELLTPVIEFDGFHMGLIILLIVSIYISSNAMSSVIISANNIYGIKQRTFLQRRVKAIIMVFIMILLVLFMVLVPVLGSVILSAIEKLIGHHIVLNVLNVLKAPLSWFVIFILIKILYTIAPDKPIPSSHVNTGAVFTALGWIISTQVYLYYVEHFAHYTLYYSGLSNLAILMIWIYILATIFVIGMGLNYKEENYEVESILQKTQKLPITKKNQHSEEKID